MLHVITNATSVAGGDNRAIRPDAHPACVLLLILMATPRHGAVMCAQTGAARTDGMLDVKPGDYTIHITQMCTIYTGSYSIYCDVTMTPYGISIYTQSYRV